MTPFWRLRRTDGVLITEHARFVRSFGQCPCLCPIDGYEAFAAFWIIHKLPVIGRVVQHFQSRTFGAVTATEPEVCRRHRAAAHATNSDEAKAGRFDPNKIARLEQPKCATVPRTATGTDETETP